MDDETLARYNRNKQMIDLEQVPQDYKDMIINEFNQEETVGRQHLFNFFITKKLKNLVSDIQDF